MKIHLAFENIDAELGLVPTHRHKKRIRRTPNGDEVNRQRYIVLDVNKRNEVLSEEENVIQKLKELDDDIDIELAGKYIKSTTRIVVNEDFKPVYNYMKHDILIKTDGSLKERPHQLTLGNANQSIPVRITNELIEPKDCIMKYFFRKSYFITHTNGLTFKFLYDIAKKLFESGKFARVDAFHPETKKRQPLVLYDNGRKFPRAYLEGKIKGSSYCLILHLSDQELKVPETQAGGDNEN